MPWLVRVLATGFAPGSLQFDAVGRRSGGSPSPTCCSSRWPPCSAACCRPASASPPRRSRPVLLNLVLIAALLATGAAGHRGGTACWPGVWLARGPPPARLGRPWRPLAPVLPPRSSAAIVARQSDGCCALIGPGSLGDRRGPAQPAGRQLVRDPSAGRHGVLPVLRRPAGAAAAGHRRRGPGHGAVARAEPGGARRHGRPRRAQPGARSWHCCVALPAAVGLALLAQPIVPCCSSAAPSAPTASLGDRAGAGRAGARVCRPMCWRRSWRRASTPRRTRARRCGSRPWPWASTWRSRAVLTGPLGHVGIALALSLVELGERAGPGRPAVAPRAAAARRDLPARASASWPRSRSWSASWLRSATFSARSRWAWPC